MYPPPSRGVLRLRPPLPAPHGPLEQRLVRLRHRLPAEALADGPPALGGEPQRGVPVVQPRTGSCPEIVESTAGGILYEPNEARPLADAIRQLMDDDDHRTKFASDGRAAVLREYTAERMAAETWKIYESHG